MKEGGGEGGKEGREEERELHSTRLLSIRNLYIKKKRKKRDLYFKTKTSNLRVNRKLHSPIQKHCHLLTK